MELLMVSLLNSEGRERKMLRRHNFDIHFFFFFFRKSRPQVPALARYSSHSEFKAARGRFVSVLLLLN